MALAKDKEELTITEEFLTTEKNELMLQLDAAVSDRRRLSMQYNDISVKLKKQTLTLKEAKLNDDSGPVSSSTPVAHSKRRTKTKSDSFDSVDLDDIHDESTLSSNISDLSYRNAELDQQVQTLLDQIAAYEAEIGQFDLVRTDWDMEKEALEDVLLKLREDLRDKEEKLNVVQAQKGLKEVERQRELTSHDISSDVDIAELSHQVELLTQGNSQLEQERDTLTLKMESLTKLVVEQKNRLAELEIEKSAKDSDDQIVTLRQELLEKEATISTFSTQLKGKDSNIINLSAQLDSQLAVLHNREETVKSLEQKLLEAEANSKLETSDDVENLHEQLKLFENDKFNLSQTLERKEADLVTMLEEKEDLSRKLETIVDESKQLSSKLEKLMKKQKEVCEERDGLIGSLEELDSQHEVALSQIIQARDKLVAENSQLKLNQSALEADEAEEEKMDEMEKELMKLRSERQKVAVTLNELHMINHDMSEAKAKLTEEKRVLSSKFNEVSKDRNILNQEVTHLKGEFSKLKGGEIEQQILLQKLETAQLENQNFQENLNSLEEQLQKSIDAHSENQQKVQSELEHYKEDHNREVSDLKTHVKTLQKEKEVLDKSLSHSEGKLSEQKRQFERYTAELESAKSLDSDGLRTEHEKILKEIQEQNLQLSEKDMEISSLKIEKDNLTKQDEEGKIVIQKHETELKRLNLMEMKHEKLQEDNLNYEAELENLQDLVKDMHTIKKSESKGIIAGFEHELASLSERFEEQERRMTAQKSEYDRVSNTVVEYKTQIGELTTERENLISQMEEFTKIVSLKDSTIKSMQDQHLNGDIDRTDSNFSNRERLKDLKSNNNTVKQIVIPNGDINDEINSNIATEEIEKMRQIISQKDTVISQLNDHNSSLLKFLEERSQAIYRDQTLLDIHKLENEVDSLRMEKDQMMSILNEKTRECSSLKNEGHRLMNVISAEKTALLKLQQDNQELLKNKDEPKENPHDDMQKDAIKKLSQIINDREMEIEALGQKNQTLLEVLQESSQEGAQISTLMRERDNLMQQLQIFQRDREQIIGALNTKHLESVSYHEEVQRLSGMLMSESQKQEQLQMEYTGLQKQFDDKQHALVKMQNEMLNYKKKYTEMDSRNNELKKRMSSVGNLMPQSTSPVLESMQNQSTVPNNISPSTELAQEMADLKSIIKSQEDTFVEKDNIIGSRNRALQEKDRLIWERDTALSQKDKMLSELHGKVHKAEEAIYSKDSEMNSYKKQADNLSFQLKGIQVEFSDLRVERDQLYERNSVFQQEICAMKEATNRLIMTVNDREFEISALKEKLNLLTMLNEQGVGEKGEMDRMMKETESLQQQTQAIKQERDQGMLALQQQQTESQQLRNEIQRLKEKAVKSSTELERLRGHLFAIEENYTQDALAAEEREKELRNRLAVAQETALSSSTAVQVANQEALRQVDALQIQLHALASQRDDALLQLSSAQESATQYATSLQNLQMVLEQFQVERETAQNAEIEKYQKDIIVYQKENAKLVDQTRLLQAQVDETSDALEAAQRLSEQLDRKEEMISALREEVQLRESQLMKSEADVNKLSTSTEAKVDKVLMKNLILGYFHTPAHSRVEAIRLIGRMLDFTASDMDQVQPDVAGRSRWFGGLFKKSSPTPTTPKNKSLDKSFSELFVNFMERESSPKPDLRLPADRMISESQRRHSHGHSGSLHSPIGRQQSVEHDSGASRVAFNPFSAPMHAAMPLQINTNSEGGLAASNHPLMKPLTPGLPLFTTAAPASSSNLLMSSTNTSSVNSVAFLRDVLQQ